MNFEPMSPTELAALKKKVEQFEKRDQVMFAAMGHTGKPGCECFLCTDKLSAARITIDNLTKRLSVMETALRNAFVIIEGLNISIEWELAPEIKKAIAESSKEIMEALSDQGGNNGPV